MRRLRRGLGLLLGLLVLGLGRDVARVCSEGFWASRLSTLDSWAACFWPPPQPAAAITSIMTLKSRNDRIGSLLWWIQPYGWLSRGEPPWAHGALR